MPETRCHGPTVRLRGAPKGQQTFVGRIDKIWARIGAISRSLRRRILCFCDALGVVQHFLVHVFLSLQYHQIYD